jgi:hypothetical protein
MVRVTSARNQSLGCVVRILQEGLGIMSPRSRLHAHKNIHEEGIANVGDNHSQGVRPSPGQRLRIQVWIVLELLDGGRTRMRLDSRTTVGPFNTLETVPVVTCAFWATTSSGMFQLAGRVCPAPPPLCAAALLCHLNDGGSVREARGLRAHGRRSGNAPGPDNRERPAVVGAQVSLPEARGVLWVGCAAGGQLTRTRDTEAHRKDGV